ncbi:CPBP family intramembrane metalloprotease, partial [Candidatus Bathyarchaeota archaeon]|nr:CPBP family intramembrane metalloprotease [Candidatus Bathyarchaeota archaeon]
YLIGVVGIGLFILTFGRTRIRPPPQNPNSNCDQPLASAMMVSSKVHRYSFLWFFVVVFVSWQLVNALFYTFIIEQFRPILFTLQIAYSALLVLIIKKENSSLANYGYWWPKETNRFVLVCLWLATFYMSVMVFVPIAFARYNIFPQPSSVEALSAIFLALVASFAGETIFRGYIQSKLTKMIGFPCALIATSVMFAANATLLWPFTLNSFFYTFLSLLVLGVFLGALFYRTKTLLCPIIFYGAVLAFESLTPVEAVISANAKLFLHFAAIALSLLMLGVLTAKKVTRRRLGQMDLSER